MTLTEQACDFAPHVRLMLCLARTQFEPGFSTRAQEIVRLNHVDWRAFVAGCEYHGVAPLAFRHCEGLVPHAVWRELKTRSQETTHFNLSAAAELSRFSQILSAADIPHVSLKGPLLAWRSYGEINLREFGDLDILVPREYRQRSIACLKAERFSPRLSEDVFRLLLPWLDEAPFEREDATIDLHWALMPRGYPLSLDMEALRPYLETLDLGRARISVLAPALMSVYLCVHGASHCWARIQWMCDLSETVARFQKADWEDALGLATRYQCRKMFLVGLLLGSEALGTVLPSEIQKLALADPNAQSLVSATLSRLGSVEPPHWLRRLLYSTRILDSPSQVLKLLRSRFLAAALPRILVAVLRKRK